MKKSLEQLAQSDAVYLITGKLADSKSTAYSVKHHTTFVWSAKKVGQRADCNVQKLYSGSADMFNETLVEYSKAKTVFRLSDAEHQVDFLLGPKVKVCNSKYVYAVKGDPHTFVAFDRVSSKVLDQRRYRPPNNSVDFSMISHHLQYIQDHARDQLNRLSELVSDLDCLSDRAFLERLQIPSSFSPVLAAAAANFSECHHSISSGQTGLLSSCKKVSVTLAAQNLLRFSAAIYNLQR